MDVKCDCCGLEFVTTRSTHRFCSKPCRMKGQARERYGAHMDDVISLTCRSCGKTEVRLRGRGHRPTRCRSCVASESGFTHGTSSIVIYRDCARCGRLFVASRDKKTLCHRPCRKVSSLSFNARGRRWVASTGAAYERVNWQEVLRRDKYRCHICDKPIKRDAKAPDPLAASVDHLIPLREGGDHTYANVAAAHWGCNAAKGHRGGGEQLALVG
jgi:5-methylcytosine-specific restriction endonuclease McrA